jgi:hypothetical protein
LKRLLWVRRERRGRFAWWRGSRLCVGIGGSRDLLRDWGDHTRARRRRRFPEGLLVPLTGTRGVGRGADETVGRQGSVAHPRSHNR